jgi:hypothetical protein
MASTSKDDRFSSKNPHLYQILDRNFVEAAINGDSVYNVVSILARKIMSK